MAIETFVVTSLDEVPISRWRAFLDALPSGHYSQDPTWGVVQEHLSAKRPRHAVFSWSEDDGRLCLAAAGVRRDSPIPGWGYYDFFRGPSFERTECLESWVAQVVPQLRRDGLVLIVAPHLRLDSGGDRVESILRSLGFLRDKRQGTWGTLESDLAKAESELWDSFPSKTRRAIRRGQREGIEVRCEDDPGGWQAFVDLHRELAARTGISPFSLGDIEALSRLWLCGGAGGTVLVARISGVPVAAFIVLVHRHVAYLLAGSATRTRGSIPVNYVLVWEVMRWAQSRGCRVLDFVGYSLTAKPGDPLWGPNCFKSRFFRKAEPRLYCAAHELALAPRKYAVARFAKRTSELAHQRRGGR